MSMIRLLKDQIFEAIGVYKFKIIIGIAVITGIIIGVSYIRIKSETKANQAWTRLWDINRNLMVASRINPEEKKKAISTAIAGYNYIIDDLSSGNVTPWALYQLGNAYYELGDFDQAIKIYQRFLQSYQNHHLVSFVRLAIGYAYEEKGMFLDAVEQYKAIKDTMTPFLTAQKNLDIGRCYERLGSIQYAIEAYNNALALENNPTDNWVRIAQQRLDALR